MKTVIINCLAALFLATLFVVSAAAPPTCDNEFGLYVAPEGAGPMSTMGMTFGHREALFR